LNYSLPRAVSPPLEIAEIFKAHKPQRWRLKEYNNNTHKKKRLNPLVKNLRLNSLVTTVSYPTKYVMTIFISLGTILCVTERRKICLLEPGQKLETKLEFPQLNRETPLLFVYTSWPSQWIKR